MPSAVHVSILAIPILLLLGWLISIIASFRSKQGMVLKLFLIFPLSNPIALLVFLIKDWKKGITPVVCYVLALMAFPIGGAIAESIAKSRLQAFEQQLLDSGEELSVQSLIPEPVSVESNIWTHPYLAPLSVAGQRTEEGEAARSTARYTSMSLPPKDAKIKYVDEGMQSGRQPLRELHIMALYIVSARDGVINESNTPQSWEECSEIIVTYFQKSEDDFAQLAEALKRPVDQYPYEWKDGMDMMMPHLARLKDFTQSATVRSEAFSTMAKPFDSFHDAQLAMTLIHTGDSDALISRLVQFAQAVITLNSLKIAQQFHVWNDEQWLVVQTQLRELDFPGLIPASIRAERIMGVLALDRLVEVSGGDVNTLGVRGFAFHRLFGGGMRAIAINERRLFLTAYSDLISAIETALEKSRTQPWLKCNTAPLPRSLENFEYGIMAKMLVPALDKAFPKALKAQTHIELALVACALERYYLSNQQYPETLQELVPDYIDTSPRDPMNHEPWHYSREQELGFRLYTVGENGIDDGGEFEQKSNSKGDAQRKDDILWSVQAVAPSLPMFEYNPPRSSTPTDGVDKQMLERYGLFPSSSD